MPVDLVSAEMRDDPVGEMARLREQAPLVQVALPGVTTPAWAATRYDEAKALLSDPRFVKDHRNAPGGDGPTIADQLMGAYGLPPEYRDYMHSLLFMDGAEHARLRKLVTRTFTVRRINALRPQVERIVSGLLRGLEGAGEVELLKDFCFPLSGSVICELVGVDEARRSQWREWIYAFGEGDPARFADAVHGMVRETKELIARRRETPTDDLVSGLIRAQDEDADRLTEAEMIAMVLLLVQAGHHTTAHLIANATVTLLDHPDQLSQLRAEPALLPRAVHELLRLVGPVPMGGLMYATEDVEIGGVTVRSGEAVVCALASANHDPRRFDGPERFDVTRAPEHGENHVAFAHGPHYCLGAALARLEAEVALDRLFVQEPGLSLAVPRDELEFAVGIGIQALVRLPVRLPSHGAAGRA